MGQTHYVYKINVLSYLFFFSTCNKKLLKMFRKINYAVKRKRSEKKRLKKRKQGRYKFSIIQYFLFAQRILQFHDFTSGNAFREMLFCVMLLCPAFCVMLFVSCFLCHAFCFPLCLSLSISNFSQFSLSLILSLSLTLSLSLYFFLSLSFLWWIYGRFRPCYNDKSSNTFNLFNQLYIV